MKNLFILLVVATLALTACGSKSTDMPQLEISDPGKSIEVTAGNEFKIVIESNPSTGYQWKMVGALDETIVQFVSNEFRASEPVALGSGGSDVWVLRYEIRIVVTNEVVLPHWPINPEYGGS